MANPTTKAAAQIWLTREACNPEPVGSEEIPQLNLLP
jgi:hypothetical protein